MSAFEAYEVNRRGWTMIELDRPKEAVPLFERASSWIPTVPMRSVALSTAFSQAKRHYKGARVRQPRHCCHEPQYDQAHARRAYALRRMKELGPALRSIEEAVRLDPNYCYYRVEQVVLH